VKLRLTDLSSHATLIKFLRNWSLTVVMDICLLHWTEEYSTSYVVNKEVGLLIGFPFVRQFPCLLCLISLGIYCISKDEKSFINSELSISSPMHFYHLHFFTHAKPQRAIRLLFALQTTMRQQLLIDWVLIT